MVAEPSGDAGTPPPAATAAWGPTAGRLTLAQSAELVGRYRWIERRLFELTGSWAPAAPIPAVAVHLDAVSLQHAWHADLWAERLPVLDGVDREALTRPTPGAAAVFDDLGAGEDEGPGSWVDRLAGLYRVVVPRLLVGYERHLARATSPADPPTTRALRLVIRDEVEAWQAGEALLEDLVIAPDLVLRAASTQGRLESLLLGAEPAAGLVPWPVAPGELPRGAAPGALPRGEGSVS